MKLIQISAVALFMITTSIASAHAPKVGANGGEDNRIKVHHAG